MADKKTLSVLREVYEEREAQDAEHGGPDKDDLLPAWRWPNLCHKHAAEAMGIPFNLSIFRRQMVVVAALAVAAVEYIDRRIEREKVSGESGSGEWHAG